jgi:hypothetical protein
MFFTLPRSAEEVVLVPIDSVQAGSTHRSAWFRLTCAVAAKAKSLALSVLFFTFPHHMSVAYHDRIVVATERTVPWI